MERKKTGPLSRSTRTNDDLPSHEPHGGGRRPWPVSGPPGVRCASPLRSAEPGANGSQSIGDRPWMRNGVTLTGNHDHAYIGQRSYGHDSTDMVISS